jgi:hypothetical protein
MKCHGKSAHRNADLIYAMHHKEEFVNRSVMMRSADLTVFFPPDVTRFYNAIRVIKDHTERYDYIPFPDQSNDGWWRWARRGAGDDNQMLNDYMSRSSKRSINIQERHFRMGDPTSDIQLTEEGRIAVSRLNAQKMGVEMSKKFERELAMAMSLPIAEQRETFIDLIVRHYAREAS